MVYFAPQQSRAAHVRCGSKREFPHFGLMSASSASSGHWVANASAALCHKPTHAPQQTARSVFERQTDPFPGCRLKGWIQSITESASTSTEDGIVMPNSFATFRFTVSSKRVGCAIGSSAGFVPWTTLSTYKATPRAASSKLSP